LFGPQDFALGFVEATVMSDGLWRRSFGADPNILGKRLRMDNDPYSIVGVVVAQVDRFRECAGAAEKETL
jgi:putative ABC transport system permease protein